MIDEVLDKEGYFKAPTFWWAALGHQIGGGLHRNPKITKKAATGDQRPLQTISTRWVCIP